VKEKPCIAKLLIFMATVEDQELKQAFKVDEVGPNENVLACKIFLGFDFVFGMFGIDDEVNILMYNDYLNVS
jgi:hypothetical protein